MRENGSEKLSRFFGALIHPTLGTFSNSTVENLSQITTFWDTTEYSNVSDRPTEGYCNI